MTATQMIDDTREIAGIFLGDEDGYQYVVGSCDISKIEVYFDNTKLWFAIYDKDDVLVARVNRDMIGTITYKKES